MENIVQQDSAMALWWGTTVECISGLMRRSREGLLHTRDLDIARQRLAKYGEVALSVEPVEWVRERAKRLLGVHAMNAPDALQLAAALSWCRESTSGRGFVCLDKHLRQAARKEGFSLFPVS